MRPFLSFIYPILMDIVNMGPNNIKPYFQALLNARNIPSNNILDAIYIPSIVDDFLIGHSEITF
jgi:hypothetical protein